MIAYRNGFMIQRQLHQSRLTLRNGFGRQNLQMKFFIIKKKSKFYLFFLIPCKQELMDDIQMENKVEGIIENILNQNIKTVFFKTEKEKEKEKEKEETKAIKTISLILLFLAIFAELYSATSIIIIPYYVGEVKKKLFFFFFLNLQIKKNSLQ